MKYIDINKHDSGRDIDNFCDTLPLNKVAQNMLIISKIPPAIACNISKKRLLTGFFSTNSGNL